MSPTPTCSTTVCRYRKFSSFSPRVVLNWFMTAVNAAASASNDGPRFPPVNVWEKSSYCMERTNRLSSVFVFVTYRMRAYVW